MLIYHTLLTAQFFLRFGFLKLDLTRIGFSVSYRASGLSVYVLLALQSMRDHLGTSLKSSPWNQTLCFAFLCLHIVRWMNLNKMQAPRTSPEDPNSLYSHSLLFCFYD